MDFDPNRRPYPSLRYPIYANRGMVAASSPQASAAGLQALRSGGNAVDAAVAAAATLTVTEPTANGIGGDAFALVWIEKDRRLYGLNASGRAPSGISIEAVLARNPPGERMPALGWLPVLVPGIPKAWASLVRRFGRRSLGEALEPAAEYAEGGYPAGPVLAGAWQRSFDRYSRECRGPEFAEWFRVFAPEGRPPAPGRIVRLPDHARTLRSLGASDSESFYRGDLADRIVRDSEEFGGFLRKPDLEGYEAEWVDPISVAYRGYEVCEIPPNGQGIVALMALNILKGFPAAREPSPEDYHRSWEAMKLAFADGTAHVTDPGSMSVFPRDLLSPDYGALRAREIGEAARIHPPAAPGRSGTVYLCTADGNGNMVSYIQSNYLGFGSGVVVRGTGIALQNRGFDFSLDPRHVNRLEPGKRTYHTIIPGFLMKDGRAVGPFGVMGGYMQPQGHVQVVRNLLDYGLDPQQALDAPRWQWTEGLRFLVEEGFPREAAEELARRGHEVAVSRDTATFGRGQIILRLPGGTLVGGTEGRTDSNIACW
ncbi:MAG TPA: gamma-glutamyltransferase family protein [Spirochaetia bacterium]|nr:gamma-glutamyltransferase family protein [Spirochaetia bacterium]